jgi:hypothetical protein
LRDLFLESWPGNQPWPGERQVQLRADELVGLLHTAISGHISNYSIDWKKAYPQNYLKMT